MQNIINSFSGWDRFVLSKLSVNVKQNGLFSNSMSRISASADGHCYLIIMIVFLLFHTRAVTIRTDLGRHGGHFQDISWGSVSF